jgi:hypothetical protein
MTISESQGILRIEYSSGAQADADALAADLAEVGNVPVQKAANSKASMAVGEVILLIAASSATKALIDIAIDRLREYLLRRIGERPADRTEAPNIRVVVERPGMKATQKLLSLRVATVDFAAEFIKQLGDAVAKSIA